MRFKETADAFLAEGRDLLEFHPFPTADERSAWEALPAELKGRLIAQGEACLGCSWPPILATDFMAFQRTGNRVDYESVYFERRYRLNSLVLAECVESRGRFLDDIINGIFVLCEESAWQLPPHNSHRRGAPQELLPDVSRPVLDLFACETGAQLACIRYLLDRQLNAVSPHIVPRIVVELERRVVSPYLHRHFWWMGDGEEPMCNWTPWCTQNVLLTVFMNGCDQTLGRAVLAKAAESCDLFLKDYGEDGCCDEGAQYFRRAGLCLDAAADLMDQVTGGAFTPLYQWQKIKNIASYIANVHVDGRYYFNFGDCSPVAGRAGVREFLFGKRTGQPELMLFSARDFQEAQDEIYSEEMYRLSLYYRLLNAFHYRELMDYDITVPAVHRDIFYPSTGLFIARNGTFCLAVKAGDNDDNHNHNDTGSLTLYRDGIPLLADIGVESYTGKTFSSRRYEIWTMQSGYHNLPAVEGMDQRDGAAYRAQDVAVSLCEDKASISMELIGAYPLPEKGHYYKRQVCLDKKENLVTLRDSTDCGGVILNFITCCRPEINCPATERNALRTGDADPRDIRRPSAQTRSPGSLPAETEAWVDLPNRNLKKSPGSLPAGVKVSTMDLGTARIQFQGAELLSLETLPITDPRLQSAWDHDLYRIRLTMCQPVFEMTIR